LRHISQPQHTALAKVEVGLYNAGVPYKSTGSTSGQNSQGTFQQQFPEHLSGPSMKNTANKTMQDLVRKTREAVTKKTAGFPGFYPPRISRRSGNL